MRKIVCFGSISNLCQCTTQTSASYTNCWLCTYLEIYLCAAECIYVHSTDATTFLRNCDTSSHKMRSILKGWTKTPHWHVCHHTLQALKMLRIGVLFHIDNREYTDKVVSPVCINFQLAPIRILGHSFKWSPSTNRIEARKKGGPQLLVVAI